MLSPCYHWQLYAYKANSKIVLFIISACHFVSVSRGEVPRNDFGLDEDLPDEPRYDKFAYENDKKIWGLDNFSEDDDEANMFGARPRKHRKLHYTSGTTVDYGPLRMNARTKYFTSV